MTVLLVDTANVVGSRPDGWWRDRPGATSRLLRRLAALPGRTVPGPDGGTVPVTRLVAVVEGAAGKVAEPDGIRLVRAPGSGDDALVATAATLAGGTEDLVVVTADRGLQARLPSAARTAGPRWLLALLDQPGEPR